MFSLLRHLLCLINVVTELACFIYRLSMLCKSKTSKAGRFRKSDLAEVIEVIEETFEPKKYFMSFLPHYFHSFRIIVIPSRLLSFQIFVILRVKNWSAEPAIFASKSRLSVA